VAGSFTATLLHVEPFQVSASGDGPFRFVPTARQLSRDAHQMPSSRMAAGAARRTTTAPSS
jgi:hypothetical protein